MSALYRLHKNPNPRKDGLETAYHARFVNQKTSRMHKIGEMVSEFSSFSAADVVGLLEVLKEVIALELSNGCNVELEGFGTFTVSLKCPQRYNKNEIQTGEIEFRTVRMRVAADFKDKVKKNFFVYKAEDRSDVRYTLNQRREILLEHMNIHRYITAKEYRYHTYLYKSAAARDLKHFIAEGIIVKKGKGPGTFYLLPE